MLVKFEVENFKSFKENFVFDLSETKNYEFNNECVKNGAVNTGLIYGVNGCGKSNLGHAIFDLISHLTDNAVTTKYYKNYLNANRSDKIATFKFHFEFDKSTLEYSYGKTQEGYIINETLKIDNTIVVNYVRESLLVVDLSGTESLNKDLSKSSPKLSALKYIKNNTILSNESKHNKVINQFFDFVDKMLYVKVLDDIDYMGYEVGNEDITQDILNNDNLKDFEIFLNAAGVKCKLKIIKYDGHDDIGFAFQDRTIRFYDAASTGTLSLGVFYFWLKKLESKKNASFVFIDEFDAFYHHELSQLVVKKLKSIFQTQVILTTHNLSIMTNDLLRPDCYFIMRDDKIMSISKSTDKELRLAHNIEKMYRAGAFHV